MSWMRQRNMPT
ncbi:hypothetical protein CIB84_010261 [Bambusicola thoracicus]|uniref:Uncharacterized protein n=1 Tax=Bambusicola thoracicus TaxID=9083 RepID=A0A2P4SPE9_BAMTH|nr:hypothetical protein CIB84_010261 [Bambusicola thoracicus]